MVTCAVYGCCNRGNTRNGGQSDVTFHTFPKDPLRKRKWVRALLHTSNSQQIANKTCTPEQSRICSAHFDEKFFDRSGVKVRLKKDAVPTIFPDVEDTVAALFSEANTPFKGKLKVAFCEDPKGAGAISEHKTAENEADVWSSPKKLPPKKAFPKRAYTPASPTKNTATDNTTKTVTQTPLKRTLLSPRQKASSSKDTSTPKRQQVVTNKTPQEPPAPPVQPVVEAQEVVQEPEINREEFIKSPPETPSVPPRAISPITPHRYRDEQSSVSGSPVPQHFPVHNGIGCESPRSFTSYYDVPVAGSEIVVTQAMIERSTSVSPQNGMWMKNHPPLFTEQVEYNGTDGIRAQNARKSAEQKYKKKIRKLQIKKRKNLLKITSINNMINKLGNQNLLIDDRIGRIVSKLTYNI